ncbi:MAG: DUF4262 domain-containing protein [Planctomycetaceae bacterium]
MKKMTPESYATELKRNIKKYGFHLTYVPAEDIPSFCYSTGVYETSGIPELFISSLPLGMASELVHSYVKRFKNTTPPIGERIVKQKKDPFDYYLIKVDLSNASDYVLASFKYYGSAKFEYLQLVFPDADLRFPHEKGYDYDQELLGDFSPTGTA